MLKVVFTEGEEYVVTYNGTVIPDVVKIELVAEAKIFNEPSIVITLKPKAFEFQSSCL